MKFKDIVNRDVVNIKNCEDELIHIPGSIQPYGFLLGLITTDLSIDFCSGNSYELIGLTYEQLLGKQINLILGDEQTARLGAYLNVINESVTAPLLLEITNRSFTCSVQKSNEVYLLEFEPKLDELLQISDIYQQTKQVAAYMQKAATLQALCQHVADETRKITGYDRVMIYRFDEEYNGEVYAESCVETLDPWLHLHYPSTDIPAQARALYMTNLVRVIADVNYVPTPIYTIDNTPGKNLDLSLSILRSSSPIHIQYLKNMGVAATLTISLIEKNRLWGLIACHHSTPKLINKDVRIAAQLQGHFLTSQIGVRQLAEEYEVAKQVNKSLDQLLEDIFSSGEISISELISHPKLLSLTNASSVIILLDDKIYTNGDTPPPSEIRKLTNWLQTYSPATGVSITNLSSLYPDSKKWSNEISGVIFHSLGNNSSNCILWCRPEVIRDVYWAGDPKDAVLKKDFVLTPRNSFQAWKELKRHQALPWQTPETLAALTFANALQKHVHMLFLAREELKQRTLNEKLKEANSELENLYWIGSHDLNEPLRKIQMFASRIMDKDYSGNIDQVYTSVKRMNDSAKRMQLLVSDVLSYSRLNFIEDGLQTVNLNELVKNIIDELSGELEDQQGTIVYNTLPEVRGINFFLQQLFINVIRNSLKFAKLATPPHIAISYEGESTIPTGDGSSLILYKINISDNGIGFDNKFSESIFKVFTRLHTQSEYAGSGVGLALCNKIMKNHHGFITAEGSPGVGTVISLFFPKPITV